MLTGATPQSARETHGTNDDHLRRRGNPEHRSAGGFGSDFEVSLEGATITGSGTFIRAAILAAISLALTSCGGDSGETGQTPDTGTDQDATEQAAAGDDNGDGAWFSIDEAAGTVAVDDSEYAIAADGTFTVDGVDYEFVSWMCPVPASGDPEDIPVGHRGVGHAPDGRPYNYNGGAPGLAFNTTFDADWTSTDTAHDVFSPVWTVADNEIRADDLTVTVVETGDNVAGSIVITCR